MLIDSTHKKWAIVTGALTVASLGLFLLLRWTGDGRWSGGSTAGLWFGIAGSGLMIYAGLLSQLRRVPSAWWLGSRKAWLRGHIWLGLLSGVLILCHSGCRWGGKLEIALWIVLIALLATGVVGLALQGALPHLVTSRVQREAPYEQIPHLVRELRRRADEVVDKLLAVASRAIPTEDAAAGDREQLRQFYENEVRPYLAADGAGSRLLGNPLQMETAFARLRILPGLADFGTQLDELTSFCEERRQLAEQERLHRWLHGWLLLHIPLSAILLVLGVAHVFASLYY